MTRDEAWKLLELSPTADKQAIRHAYAEKAKIYHVETHPEEFQKLREAYQTALAYSRQGSGQETQSEQFVQATQATETTHIPKTSSTKRSESRYSSGFEAQNPLHSSPKMKSKAVTFADDCNKELSPQKNSYDTIINQLLENKSSVSHYNQCAQIIYHKFHYEKTQINPNHIWPEKATAEQLFCNRVWTDWKSMKWQLFILQYSFLENQYKVGFLSDLCQIFAEDILTNGFANISMDFFFVLCIAYNFFEPDTQTNSSELNAKKSGVQSYLEQIKLYLMSHPRQQEFIFNLNNWDVCKDLKTLYSLYYKAFLINEKNIFYFYTHLQELYVLLDKLKIIYFDKQIAPKSELLQILYCFPNHHFTDALKKQVHSWETLENERKNCWETYRAQLIDIHPFTSNYLTAAKRTEQFIALYLSKEEKKSLYISSYFTEKLQDYIREIRGYTRAASLPSMISYPIWNITLEWCKDYSTNPLIIEWLSKSLYFPAYMKRREKELYWEHQNIQEAYLKQLFPLPELNSAKRNILQLIHHARPCSITDIISIFTAPEPTTPTSTSKFLIRLSNAMANFKFFLVNATADEEPSFDAAFCFLENEVILFQKKENQVCRISHEHFYDIMSYLIDTEGCCSNNYTDAFLDTACKNLYLYKHSIKKAKQAVTDTAH